MTASHWQSIPPGPVQLIGLPRTAMGVTNPRVLHRRALANNNNNNINNNNNNNNTLGISSVKRCLFGSPEPGEIQELYREEMRRNRDRFLKQYNYDILNERFVTDNDITNTDNNKEDKSTNSKDDTDKKSLENNHEEEASNNHEEIKERLHEAKSSEENSSKSSSSLSSSSADAATTIKTSTISTILDKNDNNCDVTMCNLKNIHLLAVENDNNNTTIKTSPKTELSETTAIITTATTTTIPPSSHKDRKTNERPKPYSRQILITEYYSTRKMIVGQLPKPQKADLNEQKKIQQKQKDHQQQKQQIKQQQTEDVV